MDAPSRVLVIEDDDSLREGIHSVLLSNGYEVRAEPDGQTLEDAMTTFRPDLALLDVRLPGEEDGFSLAERLRSVGGTPVLFVTAADGLEERLRGFELGADDYLVKPFAMAELLARIRAILRRSGRLSSPTHQVGDLLVDESSRVVLRARVEIDLTPTEFELLAVFAREPGRVFSKMQLLSLVWGFEEYDRNLVEVHVSALRRKLEATGPRLIHTERGEGYVLGPRSNAWQRDRAGQPSE